MPAATRDFLEAMAATVAGVSVVTTDGAGGRVGLTVSSTASVSAEPPMLLACINRRSPLLPAIRRNGVFGVSALAAGQAALADRFAGRPALGRPYEFDRAAWDAGATGVPLAVGAAARFECRLANTVDAGTHAIAIGEVVVAEAGDAPPLARCDRAYAAPERLAPALAVAVSPRARSSGWSARDERASRRRFRA